MMQRALCRSDLIPRGVDVESVFRDGSATVITMRPTSGTNLCPGYGTSCGRIHLCSRNSFFAAQYVGQARTASHEKNGPHGLLMHGPPLPHSFQAADALGAGLDFAQYSGSDFDFTSSSIVL